jgi:hypothetical protein
MSETWPWVFLILLLVMTTILAQITEHLRKIRNTLEYRWTIRD